MTPPKMDRVRLKLRSDLKSPKAAVGFVVVLLASDRRGTPSGGKIIFSEYNQSTTMEE